MRILVCGSRNWIDREAIRRELSQLPAGSVNIHGDNGYDGEGSPLWGKDDCLAVRGADKLAGAIATELGFQVIRFPPNWQHYGRRAGQLRNQLMLAEGRPNEVIAFTSDLAKSMGTRDMVRRAELAGIPVNNLSSQTLDCKDYKPSCDEGNRFQLRGQLLGSVDLLNLAPTNTFTP